LEPLLGAPNELGLERLASEGALVITMRCAKCARDNPEDAKFCVGCGNPFWGRCANCGAENPADASFCKRCGTRLGGVATPSAAAARSERISVRSEQTDNAALDGERKTVTALFADIKGSMDLIEDLDPEEARAIVDPALKLMMEAVHHYGGYVAQSTGDGIFALFGAPVAYEDHPQRALFAALRMQAEVRRYAERLRAEQGVNLQVRVGANTGEVVVREIRTGEKHSEYVPIGHSTSVAARLQALAAPGSIAISESLRKLVEGYFALKSLGPARIKGVSEPIEIYEVTGLGLLRTRLQRGALRGYTKFVGRQREMDAMKHAAEQAKAGHGQIVATIADAGVGKSRLFFEFKATSQSGWLVLEAFSVSHGKATAYLPLIDLLHVYFRITSDEDARMRREKVAGKVAMLDRSLEEETLPHLFALLGIVEGEDPFAQMDAQVRRRRTQDAVKRIFLRESLNQPLMLIFEDLHWIDEETQAFLNLLADGIANAPALLLVNYRPEYSHSWSSKTYYTQLRLDPLNKKSANDMLSALLGDAAELAPLKRLIIEKTQGNPLFMEEIFQAMIEDGSLQRNGTVKLIRPIEQLRLPPTLQGILAGRIDHLPPEEKELLQTLAVIGTEFPLTLVQAVVPRPPEAIDSLLSRLQTSEFIYEQPAAGDIEYTFKHALTHDVAYNSLLTERRRLLHERIARVIEALHHERLEDHYVELAHHYRSSNNTAKAVEYLHLAGEQALDRGAYAQAVANVEPALKLIERLPEEVERLRAELGVRLMEGRTVPVLRGVSSAERLQNSERVCELSEQLGDTSALIRGLFNMGMVYVHRREARRAQAIASRCLKLAEQNQDQEALLSVYYLEACCAQSSGDLLQASSRFTDLMKRLVSPPQRAGAGISPIDPFAATPIMSAVVQHSLGRPDEALKLTHEALRRARQLKHPYTLVMVIRVATQLRHQRREDKAAQQLAEEAFALSEEHGFREQNAFGRPFRGWPVSGFNQAEQMIAELEPLVALAPSPTQREVLGMLAQLYMRFGHADRALTVLDEDIARSERSGAHFYEPEIHRLKGEAIMMRDSSETAEAEKCFRKGIELARGQSAKWLELRASVSLARLFDRSGRRAEARAMLTDIYGWFTEGFDTADLKDAKKLLDELSKLPPEAA
jgi:class 3 adenylate cyclase/tetratricopeptide (TPR) repeat protein